MFDTLKAQFVTFPMWICSGVVISTWHHGWYNQTYYVAKKNTHITCVRLFTVSPNNGVAFLRFLSVSQWILKSWDSHIKVMNQQQTAQAKKLWHTHFVWNQLIWKDLYRFDEPKFRLTLCGAKTSNVYICYVIICRKRWQMQKRFEDYKRRKKKKKGN